MPRRFENVLRFLDKAMGWRRRAEELRADAERVTTPAAQASLIDRAAALEHHAVNLEETALKFADLRERSAVANPFKRLVLRKRASAADRRPEGD